MFILGWKLRQKCLCQRADQLYLMFWKTYNTITNLVSSPFVVLGVEQFILLSDQISHWSLSGIDLLTRYFLPVEILPNVCQILFLQ